MESERSGLVQLRHAQPDRLYHQRQLGWKQQRRRSVQHRHGNLDQLLRERQRSRNWSGLDNHGGTMTLADDCTVSGNGSGNQSGGTNGGGIFNTGNLSLTDDCTVTGNLGYTGGGIDNSGTVALMSCTLDSNHAKYGGGLNNGGIATFTRLHGQHQQSVERRRRSGKLRHAEPERLPRQRKRRRNRVRRHLCQGRYSHRGPTAPSAATTLSSTQGRSLMRSHTSTTAPSAATTPRQDMPAASTAVTMWRTLLTARSPATPRRRMGAEFIASDRRS